MHSIQALAVLAAAAVVSAAEVSADASVTLSFGGAGTAPAAPTITFALTLPADSSSDDWIGTLTDFPESYYKSHTKKPYSYTSTVYTTTVYTVTSCPPVIPNCPTGHVTTETITSTTVICPASTTPPPPPPTTTTYPQPPPPPPTTSCLTTSYVAPPPYSANTTSPYVKPTSPTTSAKPSQFTGAANVVGGSLSLAAVLAVVVAAL